MPESKINFDKLLEDFSQSCVEGIRRLALRHPDRNFYGVCVYADTFHGSFGLYANSEEDFSVTLEAYRRERPDDYQDAESVRGLKMNCGEWEHQSFACEMPDSPKDHPFAPVHALMEPWEKLVHSISYDLESTGTDVDSVRLLETACRVADKLSQSGALNSLRTADDFHLQVGSGDELGEDSVARYEHWCKHGTLPEFDRSDGYVEVKASSFEEYKKKLLELFFPNGNPSD